MTIGVFSAIQAARQSCSRFRITLRVKDADDGYVVASGFHEIEGSRSRHLVEDGDKSLLYVLYTFLSVPAVRSYVRISVYMALPFKQRNAVWYSFRIRLARCRVFREGINSSVYHRCRYGASSQRV